MDNVSLIDAECKLLSVELTNYMNDITISITGGNNGKFERKLNYNDLLKINPVFGLNKDINEIHSKLKKKIEANKYKIVKNDLNIILSLIFNLDEEVINISIDIPRFLENKEKIDEEGYVIKNATEKDCGLILLFTRALSEYEKLLHECVITEQDIFNALFGEKKCVDAIIAYFNNIPVGYALYFNIFSTFEGKQCIHLEDLYIKPEYRGRGYARNILSYLAKLCVDRDFKRIDWSVLKWNTNAINLYRSVGAKSNDEWDLYRLKGDDLTILANKFNKLLK